ATSAVSTAAISGAAAAVTAAGTGIGGCGVGRVGVVVGRRRRAAGAVARIGVGGDVAAAAIAAVTAIAAVPGRVGEGAGIRALADGQVLAAFPQAAAGATVFSGRMR